MVYIYVSHKLIAEHKRLPSGIKNGKRTEAAHLPYPLYKPETVGSTTEKAEKIGINTNTVVRRIYDNAKIKEQALMDVKAVLDITGIYGEEMLEEACKRLGNYKVLIIDEWLNYKINERESKFIYELIEQRCGNSPTIFVGQYTAEDWHERLGGGTQADSIMDRIIHNSYTIPTTDNNLRKLYDAKKAKAVIDSLR